MVCFAGQPDRVLPVAESSGDSIRGHDTRSESSFPDGTSVQSHVENRIWRSQQMEEQGSSSLDRSYDEAVTLAGASLSRLLP